MRLTPAGRILAQDAELELRLYAIKLPQKHQAAVLRQAEAMERFLNEHLIAEAESPTTRT